MRQLKGRGFSLVELMVAMVAGLLLVAAVSALFATIIKSNRTAMQVSRLNQELQSVTDMIARDIQRAGYDASAAERTLVSGASPFYFDSTVDLMDEVSAGSKTYRCIKVHYDDDDDGCLDPNKDPSAPCGAGNGSETRIYTYNSSDKAVNLDATSSPSCTTGSKISTENTIEISDLTFSLLPGSVSTGARTIRLTISGNDIKSPALKLTLRRDIKLRNDGF